MDNTVFEKKKAELEEWHHMKEKELRNPTGWLSIVGLNWLIEKNKEYYVGCDEKEDQVILPKRFSSKMATLKVDNENKVEMKVLSSCTHEFSIDGVVLEKEKVYVLKDDNHQTPTHVTIDKTCIFFIINRHHLGLGVRIKDTESESLKNFKGRRWFDFNPSWIINANWRHEETEISVPDVTGRESMKKSPGVADFEVDSHKISLRPITDGEKLQFVFRDGTSGKLTYGACRFLFVEKPANGQNKIELDFNRV